MAVCVGLYSWACEFPQERVFQSPAQGCQGSGTAVGIRAWWGGGLTIQYLDFQLIALGTLAFNSRYL